MSNPSPTIDARLVGPTLWSEGSVTGVVERLNVHDKNEFYLYPPLREAVVCTFPEDMFEQVRAAIKRNVTVNGTLSYASDNAFPTKVRVKSLEVHPPNDQLPTMRDLSGSFKDAFGGKTAVEFLRTIRDECD